MPYSLKQKLGAVVYEGPNFILGIRPRLTRHSQTVPWVLIHNRNEKLIADERGLGVKCDWEWTSDLYISNVFPVVGLMLMKRAMRDWPIGLKAELANEARGVEVSFIIGHRGRARLSQLLLTLQSIAAQRGASIECIVVEQSIKPEINSALPGWVRYVHTPLPHPDMPYCRSWAFNVGARQARGKILIMHDNDMLVPQDYASEIQSRHDEGYEVINLKRFIFYLTRKHSEQIFSSGKLLIKQPPDSVVQNLEAGGSLAIDKGVYFELGGFDESFVGWGGEDNEFWERAQTRKVWPYGYLPFIHLWHESQPEKVAEQRKTAELFEARSAMSALERINELAARSSGDPKQLAPPYLPAEQERTGAWQ